ncbi:MAG TPA: translation elongation factor Ts [Pirellulales bacterium]|nr:translation elongation factor Ts [Pirellulales bacterium]
MAQITASSVKSLRDRTGLPMMDCKRALQEAEGDEEAAVETLRKQGVKTQSIRQDRETTEGRFAIYTDFDAPVGVMIELRCESAPVAKHEEFDQLAQDMAKQLATGPGAETPDQLLDQPSPSQPGATLRDQKDNLFNRMREVFNLARIVRIDAPCGGYAHHAGVTRGVLLEVEGGDPSSAKDVCMHIAAMNPSAISTEDLDPAVVAKEREILMDAARQEGKPENIIEKMVAGRMQQFYAQQVLTEQPFVKDDKQTVGKFAGGNGMKLIRFVHWELGKD